MASTYKGIFIIGAKRTPFCGYGGSLKELPASHAFAAAAKDAIQTANLQPELIDNTVVGNAFFLSQCDGGKTPRYCGIYSGVPINKPALGVNKTCGSGIQSIISGAVDIMTGAAKISLTGGTEIMSALPLLVRNIRFGAVLGSKYVLDDHNKTQIIDSYTGLSLHATAENLAKKYKVKREQVDEYAEQSHIRWKSAQEANIFKSELVSVTVNVKKKDVTIDKDELGEKALNKEELGCLPPIVDGGDVVTSGNSAILADGAAALILASEEAVKQHKLQPLVRIAGWVSTGVDPKETGLGAATAIQRLLDITGMKSDDVDLYEINETFASEVLITIKELNLDASKVNVHGGAIASGHPVAATGARMTTHLVYQLRQKNIKRAVAASSCGGGQGVAVMLEQA